jgi:hypothetical protein
LFHLLILIEQIMTRDIRNEITHDEHLKRVADSPVDDDAPIRIRFLRADEAAELSRCVYRSYGGSYDSDWVYQPDIIADKISRGMLRSIVGIDSNAEIVGHAGMNYTNADALVAESGQAVVDPRYRGHHIFTSLKSFMVDHAKQEGLLGIYSEATAVHPYSQKANLDLGAHETGILLGYIPQAVEYKQIATADADESSRRQSVTLFYLKTNVGAERPVYAPTHHHGMVADILSTSGIHGKIEPATQPTLHNATKLDIQLREKHRQAIMSVERYGNDFVAVISEELSKFCTQGYACIYVDLPLAEPATEYLGKSCEELGFFFGGVFPHMRGNGDVLRLQYLNNVQIDMADIQVASNLGRRLLDYIQQH